MPLLAEQHLPIPNKDLLSWMLDWTEDDPSYDVDRPVWQTKMEMFEYILNTLRSILMRQILQDALPTDKQEKLPEGWQPDSAKQVYKKEM